MVTKLLLLLLVSDPALFQIFLLLPLKTESFSELFTCRRLKRGVEFTAETLSQGNTDPAVSGGGAFERTARLDFEALTVAFERVVSALGVQA